jgi:hypothetical protein
LCMHTKYKAPEWRSLPLQCAGTAPEPRRRDLIQCKEIYLSSHPRRLCDHALCEAASPRASTSHALVPSRCQTPGHAHRLGVGFFFFPFSLAIPNSWNWRRDISAWFVFTRQDTKCGTISPGRASKYEVRQFQQGCRLPKKPGAPRVT